MMHVSSALMFYTWCFLHSVLCIRLLHSRRLLVFKLWCNFLIQRLPLLLRMPLMEEVFQGEYRFIFRLRMYPNCYQSFVCRCGDHTVVRTCVRSLIKNCYLIPELGPCSLKITYSAHTDLSVKFQSHRSRDYTNPLLPVAPSAMDASGQFSVGVDGKKMEPESNVLLASIENMQYAVTLDVLHTVFSSFGHVLKIAMFDKNGGLQALIQYPDVQTAVVAKEALEGHCIYDGGYCKIHMSYSRHTDLSIKVNNDRSRDYTIPSTPVLNSQPSILGQQPYTMGGPGGHAYSGSQYAPAPDPRGPPSPSAGWNPARPQSMQMHNYYPYGPPPGTPTMGPASSPFNGQNGLPYSSHMPPYHPR
ncbi:hypothetical protein ACJIZ3_022332 [Penstemon smallii]|uniref:PTBP1-like RNA recognition motif 2 domain-containing protein n=1 Tax=Penstemon smallii TaxID=265156 RepID=A0ABD3TKX4_9LAMI